MVATKWWQLNADNLIKVILIPLLTNDFTVFRGVFRILLNINNEAFLQKWLKTVSCYMLFSEAVGRSEVFCKKGVLKNFTNSQENTCARVSYLIKLQASGTGVFLWILWNF